MNGATAGVFSVVMLHRILAPFFIVTASLHAVPVYIGTNTGGKSASKGIYLADFDEATGKLTTPGLAAEYGNPGFLALHPTKPIVYSCGVSKTPFPDRTSSIAAFTIGKDGALTFLGEASGGGQNACHVAVDATGRTAAIANYGDGNIATIRLGEDGVPGKLVSKIVHEGTGPNKSRQERPHAHGVYFDKANKHLMVPDLGLDRVFVFPFDESTSALGEPTAPLVSAPGAGPRHLALSPDQKNAYVINELDNTIQAAAFDHGTFTNLKAVPTLPADFKGNSTTAEVEVHPNGRFVYGSNRGDDSIVVYQRDAKTGELILVQRASCGGKVPRHFKIDPKGKWLLCAHQDSNTIRVMALDPETGKLGEPGPAVDVPSPICLLFAR